MKTRHVKWMLTNAKKITHVITELHVKIWTEVTNASVLMILRAQNVK